VTSRRLVTALVGFGPAVAWIAWVTWRHAPTIGPGRAFALAAFTGLGVLGLSALVLAWTPWLLERAGLGALAARLRRHWDEDAR